MTQNPKTGWTPLYRAGSIAALIAAVLFRRNLAAEVSLFTGMESIPQSAAEWFHLLQTNPFVGLSFLAVFDLVNFFLVGLVFLAFAAAPLKTILRKCCFNKNFAVASGCEFPAKGVIHIYFSLPQRIPSRLITSWQFVSRCVYG